MTWSPKLGNFILTGDGEIMPSNPPSAAYVSAGNTAETEEQAAIKLALFRRHARLVSWLMEHQDEIHVQVGIGNDCVTIAYGASRDVLNQLFDVMTDVIE